MELLTQRWSDFKSFQGLHELDFTRFAPGLYFLRGENRQEKDLGANGAGKSTIWDVTHWILFGASVRGVRSPQLVPWQKTGSPKGSLVLRMNGEKLEVRRSYRPASITLVRESGREEKITQQRLDDLIGLSPDTFQSSVVVGQYSRLFFDLRPREKLLVFTELMNLDYWLECAKRVSQSLSRLSDEHVRLEREVVRHATRVQESARSIKRLREQRDNEPSARRKSQERLKAAIVANRLAKVALPARLVELQQENEKIEEESEAIGQRMRDLHDGQSALSSAAQSASMRVYELRKSVDPLKESLALLRKTRAKCPTCKQRVSSKHLAEEAARVKARIEDARVNIAKGKQKYERLCERLRKRMNRIAVLGKQLNKLRAAEKFDEIRDLKQQAADLTREIEDLCRRLEAGVERRQFYDRAIDEERSRLSQHKKRRRSSRLKVLKKEGFIEQAKYWSRGFKDVRLYEINEALASLRVEVNSYLVDLGMEDWTVEFEVERETKKGKVSKGFRILVDPGVDGDQGLKPWEAWSGGEGQRLRLAGTLALSNLILRQYNRMCNVQVWDEKLVWLSGTGRDDMLDLLRDTAKREGRQIWVVDQHALDYPFDGVVSVVKDADGSHLEG